MKKLKEILMESYAWEKKPGKPLPTLAEVQAEYESKMKEQSGQTSWDMIDKQMDAEAAAEIENAKKFANTPSGMRAIRVIKRLISKPYTYDRLDSVLQSLKLDKQHFKYAADAAGMNYRSSGAGIAIDDENYLDPDVSIDYINGEWIVG